MALRWRLIPGFIAILVGHGHPNSIPKTALRHRVLTRKKPVIPESGIFSIGKVISVSYDPQLGLPAFTVTSDENTSVWSHVI